MDSDLSIDFRGCRQFEENHYFYKLDDNLVSELEEQLNFEAKLWQCTPESLNEASQMAPFENKILRDRLLIRVGNFRPLNFKLVGDFIKEKIKNIRVDHSINDYPFSNYLYFRGLTKDNCSQAFDYKLDREKEIEKCENPINDEFWESILNDDVQAFNEIIMLNEYDFTL